MLRSGAFRLVGLGGRDRTVEGDGVGVGVIAIGHPILNDHNVSSFEVASTFTLTYSDEPSKYMKSCTNVFSGVYVLTKLFVG